MEDYILIIESNEEVREYPFSTEILGSLNGVHDEIIISAGSLFVNKKIKQTETDMYYILETPYILEIETEPIKLFNDYNKIYIQTLNGDFVLEYILDNPFMLGLATKHEVQTSIDLSLDKITLKVNKNEIISEINQTLEEVNIKSNKISLEGHTTVNEHFKITPQGDMECVDANINNLVNKSGVFTGLVFHHKKEVLNVKGASLKSYIGYRAIWNANYTNATLVRVPLYINYTIPDNFIVTDAFLQTEFQSVNWSSQGALGSGIVGVVKDIEVYIKPSTTSTTTLNIPSTYNFTNTPHFYIGSRVNDAWGSGVHAYTFPNGLRRKKTANIASALNNTKSGILALSPRATTVSFNPDDMLGYGERRHSGYMSATLYVYGYLNKEE